MSAQTETPGIQRLLLNAKVLLKAEQLAKVLQVPKSWIYEQSRQWEESEGSRGIPTVTLGRYRRYDPEEIYLWIKGQAGGQQ